MKLRHQQYFFHLKCFICCENSICTQSFYKYKIVGKIIFSFIYYTNKFIFITLLNIFDQNYSVKYDSNHVTLIIVTRLQINADIQ